MTSFTLDRSRRIRRRADFVRIQPSARRVVTAHFVLLIAAQEPRGQGAAARIGLIASRRVGGAVTRNRIKRVCRECFRLSPGLLPAEIDLIVIARDGAESLKLQEVRLEWERATTALHRRAAEALAQSPQQPHVSAVPKSPRARTRPTPTR